MKIYGLRFTICDARWSRLAGVISIIAGLCFAGHGNAAEFYATNEAELVQAITDAANSGVQENIINIDRVNIDVANGVVIDGGFGPTHHLTIRPGPRLSERRRAQIRSNGPQTIVALHSVGYVTLQDLDVLRTTYNRSNLVTLTDTTNVVVERCRVGSISSSGGRLNCANIAINHPVNVIVRNTICFAYRPGTLDVGILLFQETASTAGLWLYNNLVADHRQYGLDLTASGDSVLVLRNNVVVNRLPGAEPEPTAYHSVVDPFAVVITSDNTAFASSTHIEQQDSSQPIAGIDKEFLRLDPSVSLQAFLQTRWVLQPPAHPNWNLFRLRDTGPLHQSGSVRGITVDHGSFDPFEEGNPHRLDIAVTDDIEKDVRPSDDGGSHTDRGPDQYRRLTVEDLTQELQPRIPSVEPVRLRGGNLEVVAVGPQEDLPGFDIVMRSGNYTAGGRIASVAASALEVPHPPTVTLLAGPGNQDLRFTWPVSADGFVIEMTTAIGGGTPDPAGNWQPLPADPTVVDDQFVLVRPALTTGNQFYRLRRSY